MRLPIPPVGERAHFKKGRLELVLESSRGGLCLVTPKPEPSRRHFLGLPRDGFLELTVRAPEHRVRVHLQDRVTLASGGRLHGYLTVPLPHRLVWRRPDGETEPLLDVNPRELQTSWLGEGKDGGYILETESAFHLDRRGIRVATVALVPVVIANRCDHAVSPEDLTISIRDGDICELDGQIITAPRRLYIGEEDKIDEEIRPLPRRSA